MILISKKQIFVASMATGIALVAVFLLLFFRFFYQSPTTSVTPQSAIQNDITIDNANKQFIEKSLYFTFPEFISIEPTVQLSEIPSEFGSNLDFQNGEINLYRVQYADNTQGIILNYRGHFTDQEAFKELVHSNSRAGLYKDFNLTTYPDFKVLTGGIKKPVETIQFLINYETEGDARVFLQTQNITN